MQTTTLSFSVRRIASDAALASACIVRAETYGQRVPTLKEAYALPDPLDESGTCCSFLAVDKASGAALGTMRVQLSTLGSPLMLESSYRLPDWLEQRPRAELTRMSVTISAHPLVRLVLWKAGYYYCLANQIQCMVIGARHGALIRQYKALGFEELTTAPVPFAHAGSLPHSVLWFDLRAAERLWHDAKHPLYTFMAETYHPDIDLFGPVWRPKTAAQPAVVDEDTGTENSSDVSSQRISIE